MIEKLQIRDIKTKEVLVRNGEKMLFRSYVAARNYILSMKFGLEDDYEIYDSLDDYVIKFVGKSRTQKFKEDKPKNKPFWLRSI